MVALLVSGAVEWRLPLLPGLVMVDSVEAQATLISEDDKWW